jgi:peptide/nickel transport system permease protein
VRTGYLVRRVLIFLLVVWAAATVNFIIPRLARGDPIQAQFAQLEALGIRSEGMDRPEGDSQVRVREKSV